MALKKWKPDSLSNRIIRRVLGYWFEIELASPDGASKRSLILKITPWRSTWGKWRRITLWSWRKGGSKKLEAFLDKYWVWPQW